ncbi:MAG: PAS domain S-box protein [Candidatus Aegiribacteria sp.]|nr:PAS domain S-box protein [Candidatus Aegiribacteria sp.]
MPDKNEVHLSTAEYKKLVSELEESISARMRAEEDLHEQMNFSQTLLQASPAFFVAISADGKTIMVNETMLHALGYEQEEVVGKDYMSTFVPERDREDLYMIFEKLVTSTGPTLNENYILAKDGRELLVEWHGRTVFNENDEFDYFFGVGIDITERKQAEEALRRSKQFLTDVFESVQDGISVLYPDLTIRHVNGIMNEWYKDNLPLVGAKCYEVYHNADKPCDPCPTIRCLRSGESEWNIVPGLPGSPIEWIELFSYPIKDANSGEITGVVEFVRDITRHRQAEAALHASEERHRMFFESAPIGIMHYNSKGIITDSNDVAILTFGSTREKMIGLDLHVLPNKEFLGEITRTLKGERGYYEGIYTSFTGEKEAQIKAEWIPIIVDGKVTGGVGIVADITEKIKLEAQLRQAQKMESIGRLAGGVAHDFNNMLGVILGHTEMALIQMDPAHPLHNHLTEIRTAAERSADLTRQLLAFARKQTIAPRLLNLNNTLEGMLKMLRRLIGENIDLVFLAWTDLWPVKMDPVQIDQILANLCVNARDSINGVGKITIETENIKTDEAYCSGHPGFIPGEYVLLTLSDTGCGMDSDTKRNLFEPFFTTKEVGKGTGLGLATLYGIVKQNKGFIDVYSEPDHGTIFKIYLPRHTAVVTAIPMEGHLEPVRGGHETILLVEDEISILQLIMMMLEHQGYTVMTASTPGEAINLAKAHPGEIDLLMTDVVMPEMNGGDLARNLLSFYPNLKQLFMSGYTANVIAHQGVLEEGVLFIQKPFRNLDLAAKLREALDS